ncbi:MAG TPA: hypothetical protein VI485_06310 [Vicinamibacterales bacterium]|nr:hypothetical protein [Vicinamibacterales bacterium]
MAAIFVEILVRAPMEELWTHIQKPDLHERWDLRFSEIEYLPKEHEAAPQRFRYITRIGFGLEVSGEGESVGETNLEDGSRSSALKFSSRDRAPSFGKPSHGSARSSPVARAGSTPT